mmetsp:Transcript_24872/g.35719  ORF Transcript_24872/g.35719 Transcript_24872/m.35719 type:complete len:207 (+) Transcript_24872:881-1501(+)
MITIAGSVGFVQLLFFKQIWSGRFTDTQLMLIGITLMLLAQLLVIPFGGVEPDFTRFMLCIILMYAVGYPVGHTAVLGAFSKLQREGRQAALLGWFASAGSLARILFPVMAGVLDSKKDNAPYSVVLVFLSLSAVGILLWRNWIEYFTGILKIGTPNQTALSITQADNQPASRNEPRGILSVVEQMLVVLYTSLFLFGVCSLLLKM